MSIQAVSKWQSEIQQRRAALLNQLLASAVIGGLAALVLQYLSIQEGQTLEEQILEMWPFVASWAVILIVAALYNLAYNVRAWFSIVLAYALGIFVFYRGGIAGSGREWMLLPPLLAFVLLGARSGIFTVILSGLIYVAFAVLITQKLIEPPVLSEPDALTTWLAEGASFLLIIAILALLLRAFSRSWLEALQRMSAANEELEETNVQLHRQASQLRTTTKIAHAGSSILEPDVLQAAVVSQIQEGFELMGVYFVGLFLVEGVDIAGEQLAVLKAATGEAGQLLLEMDHRARVSETNPVGWCIIHQRAHVAQDVQGKIKLGSVPMPNTRSEIALPLHSRGRTLGALDVHSTREEAFSEEDIATLQTLTDQIAVAIDNARLFNQTETALEEVQAAHRRYLAEAWEEFLAMQPANRLDYGQPGAEPAMGEEVLQRAQRAATVHGRTVATSTASDAGEEYASPETALVVPLKLRGQVIGTMTLHEMRHQRTWTVEEIALAETVAEQVALTLENLRLMDETQRRAIRERLVSEITARMRETLDIDTVLQTAIREIGETLNISEVEVRMGNGAEIQGAGWPADSG